MQNLGLKYRPDSEVEVWKQRDPIFTLEAKLETMGVVTADQREALWAELRADIADAITFAEESPYPDRDQILEDVYTRMEVAG